jgi:hypothetical protein
MDKKHWIQNAIQHPGALHKALGVAEDKNIPIKKLEKVHKTLHAKAEKGSLSAAESKMLHRVNLARTLHHLGKK